MPEKAKQPGKPAKMQAPSRFEIDRIRFLSKQFYDKMGKMTGECPDD